VQMKKKMVPGKRFYRGGCKAADDNMGDDIAHKFCVNSIKLRAHVYLRKWNTMA
jgi:hypothetical protein